MRTCLGGFASSRVAASLLRVLRNADLKRGCSNPAPRADWSQIELPDTAQLPSRKVGGTLMSLCLLETWLVQGKLVSSKSTGIAVDFQLQVKTREPHRQKTKEPCAHSSLPSVGASHPGLEAEKSPSRAHLWIPSSGLEDGCVCESVLLLCYLSIQYPLWQPLQVASLGLILRLVLCL